MTALDNIALPGNILDRVLELERKLRELYGHVAMATADPSGGDTAITYIEILNQLNEGPDIDLVDSGTSITIGRGGDTILIYDSAGAPIAAYAATSAGLDLASAAATAGDVVWLPAITIADDHALTAGVHYKGVSRYASILTGLITLGAGTTLECVTINRTANDANPLIGAAGPGAGVAKIRDCDITCTQAGAGNAFAVSLGGAGNIEAWLCALSGQSTGGTGYGGSRTGGGNLYLFAGLCLGSSFPLSE